MSALAVARKDFRGVRRTKTLWALAGVLTLLAGLFAYVFSAGGGSVAPTAAMLGNLTLLLGLVVPIVTIVATYLAVVGRRENGELRFLLSMPITRGDVVAGTFLSRLLAVSVCVLVAFAVVVVQAGATSDAVPLVPTLGLVGLTLLYAAVFVALAIGVSAAVVSRARAIAGAVAVYFLTTLAYLLPVANLTDAVRYVHGEILGYAADPDLYNAVQYTSPYVAYRKATNLVLPTELANRPFVDSARGVEDAGDLNGLIADPDLPLYLTDEFSLVVLAGWILVPLLVGYVRFRRADLG